MTGAAVTGKGRAARSGTAAKASVIVFSETFANIARVVAVVILARHLPKEVFGSLSFVLLTYVALSSLSQIGLPESVYFFFEKVDRASRGRFVLLVARLLLVLAAVMSGLLLLVGFVADGRGHDVMPLFLALLLLPLLELPTMPVTHVLIATDRARGAAWLNTLFGVALFAAMVVPVLAGLPVVYVARGLVLYGGLRLAISVVLFLRHFSGELGPLPRGMTGELLSYSIPLGLAQLIMKLNQIVDKYVVMYFLPMAVFAEYSVGSWEIPFVPSIATAVGAVMLPQFVAAYLDGRKKDLLHSWTEALKRVSVIVLPLMVLLIVVAREFIIVLFSERYVNAVLPFQIYTLILFQRVTSYDAVLRAIDRTRTITVWAMGTILINLALSIPLVITMGMVGAALSTLIANVIMWVFVLVKISEGLDVPPSEVFPFRYYGRVLGAAVLAGIPVLTLPVLLEAAVPVLLGAKVVLYAAAFAMIGTATGVLGRREWAAFASALGRR